MKIFGICTPHCWVPPYADSRYMKSKIYLFVVFPSFFFFVALLIYNLYDLVVYSVELFGLKVFSKKNVTKSFS